jgi:predicted amidohydrolase YtcJ
LRGAAIVLTLHLESIDMAHHCDHGLSCGCHNPTAEALLRIAVQNSPPAPDAEATPAATVLARPETPFILIHNNGGKGTIRTVADGDGTATAEALVVFGDQILFVGTLGDAKTAAEAISKNNPSVPDLQTIALSDGQCVIPGLIEPHVHITTSPVMMAWNNYSPFGDKALGDASASDDPSSEMEAQCLRPDYCLAKLCEAVSSDLAKQKTDASKSDWWLLGDGVDTSLMTDFPDHADGKNLLNCIDKTFLDPISDQTPIMLISASEHTAYVNTPVLKAMWKNPALHEKLKKQFKSEEKFLEKASGVLQEMDEIVPALISINKRQMESLIADMPGNLIRMLKVAQKRGVTLVYDAGMQTSFAAMIKNTLQGQKLLHPKWPSPRIGMAHLISKLDELPKDSFAKPVHPTICNPYETGSLNFYFGSLKIVSDGSNQGLTGYQIDPYCCPPENHYGLYNFAVSPSVSDKGTPEKAPADFIELVSTAWQKNWPMMIHANGERAIEYALQAYEASAIANADISATDLRNRIEHCSLLTDERLERIKNSDIHPSYLIGHVGYWGWTFSNYIFREKAEEQLDRCNSSIERDICFTLHSDCAVSPLGPLRMMEQAVTRKMEGSANAAVLNAQERITSAQALVAATYNAAWQCHADHLVGSLEIGKLADLVILGEDPVKMDAQSAYMKMRNIDVQHMLIGGRNAF